jgi:iron complex transport system substrate-binding protein
MRRLVWTIATLLTVAAGPDLTAAAQPQRVVSLNLCADQLLLALADRDQIASLSPLVRDRSISFLAGEVGDTYVNDGSGEGVLFRGAGLVLLGRYGSRTRLELLQRQGVAVMVLDPWRDLDAGRSQIKAVSQRLGHPERGEDLIARIDAALARAKDIVPAGRSVLTYYRRGWVPAADSFLNALLRHMGFLLHQDRLGLRSGGVSRLESVVQSPPDYIVMDDIVGQAVDNGSALLVHPALLRAVPAQRRLVIDGRLTICGGPATPAAIDALAEEVRKKVR